ncbi:MAG TPA: tetratricopeptide repeat protein, partial [Chitinophagaceae bacterium]|nr:tetratricopeptide repeat protein [Chitinophagaceae bacterium]
MKSAIKPILSLFFLLYAGRLSSQCPSSGAAWMDKIISVEDMDDGPAKIKALTDLQSQHASCKAHKDSILARILHRLGNQYFRTGDVERSIIYTKHAVAINSSAVPGAQRHYLANSFFNLGLSYAALNLFSEAADYFDSCIDIGLQFEKTNLVQWAFEEQAFAFYRAADYQKAIEVADKGALFANQSQNTMYEAIMQMQKAQAALELNNIAEAEKSIRQALPVLTGKEADTIRMATAYSIYAKLLNAKKDPRNAAVYYKKAFDLNRKIGNNEQCARDMLDLGRLYDEELNDLSKAIACFNEGLKLNAGKSPHLTSGLFINMGSAYWHRKDYRNALECYQKSLRSFPIGFTGTAFSDNPTAVMLKLSGNDYFLYTLLSNKGESLLDLAIKENQQSLLHTA